MIALIRQILAIITFVDFRARRTAIKRRKNYDAIKALIVQEHLAGRGGLVLDKKKFDLEDLGSFKPPMYQIAQTSKRQPVIFWRKDLMTEEVGPTQVSGA